MGSTLRGKAFKTLFLHFAIPFFAILSQSCMDEVSKQGFISENSLSSSQVVGQ